LSYWISYIKERGIYFLLKIYFKEATFMKVVVGKMPGGRATEVEIPEGGTVLDAIKAAGYESDLNNGFEARLNNSQTELSSTVSTNAIITLTSKITGNGISAISVVPIAVGEKKTCEKFVVLTPTIIHDFINLPDVKDMLIKLKNTVLSSPIKCIIADSENLKVSKPADVIVIGETVICADTSYAIASGNYVVFCDETVANQIYTKDPLSAITYIEGYLPDEDRNPKSLAASAIPEGAEEIEVVEEDIKTTKKANEVGVGDGISENVYPEAVGEANVYEAHCGAKEDNPCCCESECCEDCDSDTCGGCGDTEGRHNNDIEGCCCDKGYLPEEYLTISELVAMCKRLGIEAHISIPGATYKN
jgi:hypothetical protein